MKRLLKIIIISAILACIFAFCGCRVDNRPVYEITFVGIGNETIATVSIRRGDGIIAPEIAEKEGYESVWTDERGARVAFPKAAIADEIFKAAYDPIIYPDAYTIEYYFEDENGEFIIDDGKTIRCASAVDKTVICFAPEFERYLFDAENPLNVTSAKIEANNFPVLKFYYKRVSATVAFVANGEQLKSVTVAIGHEVDASQITAPLVPGKTFRYWSLSDNGPAYDFSPINGNIVLYAVYRTETAFHLDVELLSKLYYLEDPDGEAWADKPEFDPTDMDAGSTFVFSVQMFECAIGDPIVTASYVVDGALRTSTLTPNDRGFYAVTMDSDVTVTVSGLALRQYRTAIVLVEPHCGDAVKPYKSLGDIFIIAECDGAVTVHEPEIIGGRAILDIPCGVYSVYAAALECGEYSPLSEKITFELYSYMQPGNSGIIYQDKELLLLRRVELKGDGVKSENGIIENTSGNEFSAGLKDFCPGTGDFVISAAFDQKFDEPNKIPHGADAAQYPDVGIKFTSANGTIAKLYYYDIGVSVIECGTRVQQNALLCKAGALFGRPEWKDCYRRATVTFVKNGNFFYATVSADGNGGGVESNGVPYAPTTAAEYRDYLMYYIDLATGTAYFNVNKLTGARAKASVFAAATVLKDVVGAEIFFSPAPGKSYVSLSGYGYAAGDDFVADAAGKICTTVSGEFGSGVRAKLDEKDYDGERIDIPIFSSKTLSFLLPNGKIIDEFTDCGEDVAYERSGKAVSVRIPSTGMGVAHKFHITLKDGAYYDSTEVTINASMSASYAARYDYSMLHAVFTDGKGNTKTVESSSFASIKAVLPAGKWSVVVSNGYLQSRRFEIVCGESISLSRNVLLSISALSNGHNILGNLQPDETRNALLVDKTYGNTQERTVGGATFVPNEQILEFGYTIKGFAGNCPHNAYYYPFLGMFVADELAGQARLVNRENGGNIGVMARDDYLSRIRLTVPGDNYPFATRSGGYTWENNKPWIMANEYALEMKIRVDGYKWSVWARTSESKKQSSEWLNIFVGGDALDMYDLYNSDKTCDMGNRRNQHLSTLYDPSKQCSFGITARRDLGHTDDIVFEDIWYTIKQK